MKPRDITLGDVLLGKAATAFAFLGCLVVLYAFFSYHGGFPDMDKPGAWVVFLIFAALTALSGRNFLAAMKKNKTADVGRDAPPHM
jgi:hypothetical protein